MAHPVPDPQSAAARTLRRIADGFGTTHVEQGDRVRLRSALEELCRHRPDLRRQCERAFSIANTCSVPIASAERDEVIRKLKALVTAIAGECEKAGPLAR